ncbi:WhiB family transcriptional regulator [Nocardia sp. CA-290969]|uniref:WhiB family transcriptional regulator n=1 Tax=Nocardia sp. CA-290969 TaxID=3239986 RepID=UPI003D93C879
MTAPTPRPRPEWEQDAACGGHAHPEWWFPASPNDPAIDATIVCIGCKVRRDCGLDAVLSDKRFGVRAGYRTDKTRSRRELRRYLNLPEPEGKS